MKPSHLLACAAAVLALAGCNSKHGSDNATEAPVKIQQVAPPKGGDWTQVVNPTPDGGYMMGNPNAKVKLIEIGSLTCPHCKAFEDEGVPSLVNNYVKTGQVSWEFRNYVRDAFDLTAALITRCNGAKSFFPLTQAMYDTQLDWIKKVQDAPQAQVEQLQNLPPNRQFLEMAKVAGFQQWAAMRGIPLAKSTQCLTDDKAVDQLVQMASDTNTQFPDFQGTPTFIINGTMVQKVGTWDKLEPQIKQALGAGS